MQKIFRSKTAILTAEKVTLSDSCKTLGFEGTKIAGNPVSFAEDMNKYGKTVTWGFEKNPSKQIPDDGTKTVKVSNLALKTEKNS